MSSISRIVGNLKAVKGFPFPTNYQLLYIEEACYVWHVILELRRILNGSKFVVQGKEKMQEYGYAQCFLLVLLPSSKPLAEVIVIIIIIYH